MKVQKLVEIIGSDFYTGVPDSQLKALCNYLMDTYGIDPHHHVIAANEGNAICVDTFEDLDKELEAEKERNELSLIEVKCSIGAREDLGRPTTTALENKQNFMEYLKTL